MSMLRRSVSSLVLKSASEFPVVTITGPRQAGKTTLARALFPDLPYVNFERPDVRERFQADALGFLSGLRGGAVFDEVQRVPALTSWLQAMVDEEPVNGRFILTGSVQFELMSTVSQSLAGRTALVRLLPFSLEELGPAAADASIDTLLFRGFYPRIHDQGLDPTQAYGDYVQTYIERDVRQFSEIRHLAAFQRFLRLCAGRAGQLLNLESLGADAGISGVQARQWLTVLEASYLVFLLPPWFSNIGKRLTKSPKLYFYDVGLAAWLSGIEKVGQLSNHPLRGAFFENLIVMEALKRRFNAGRTAGLHFFRDARGLEVDLLWPLGQRFIPIEIKSGSTIASDFFSSIDKLRAILPELCDEGMLVYGGREDWDRSGAKVRSYADFASELPL
ncbi:MAG TPA: ATP-binding protein [Rectinemataceae bacterium]|nr:ATP-binding protein [Rectinemataceae bacterium]